MADAAADAGSMIDSVILVMVRSRSAGRKFLTPDIKLSKLDDSPDSLSELVSREEMDVRFRNRSLDAALVVVVFAVVVVIMVMRVVVRTLGKLSNVMIVC